MSFSGRFVPQELGGRNLGAIPSVLLRFLYASIAAAAIVGIGSAAMLFTTGPEWASLLFEPMSLVLLPGLFVGMVLSGAHDLEPRIVLLGTIVFYIILIFALLELQAWRQRRRQRRRRG